MTNQSLDWLAEIPAACDLQDASRLKRLLETYLRPHLSALGHSVPAALPAIAQLLKKLDPENPESFRMFTGEIIALRGSSGEFLFLTDRGLAHVLRLPHETGNAFVLSPDCVTCWLQRRAHNKKQFPLALTIPGGHVEDLDTAEQTIRAEIGQEFQLPAPLRGRLVQVCRHAWDVPADPNLESRTLWLYVLDPAEENILAAFGETLERQRASGKRADFERWLERWQKASAGAGEVWGIYSIAIRTLLCNGNRSLPVSDTFRDRKVTENAALSGDLLADILQTPWIVEAIRRVLDVL